MNLIKLFYVQIYIFFNDSLSKDWKHVKKKELWLPVHHSTLSQAKRLAHGEHSINNSRMSE